MSIFLGKPNSKTEDFIKDQWCDIFIKDDGTKVRPAYDATKTMVNLYDVDDYENIQQFSFGKSYTEIDNLYYYDRQHGVDLSRTKIESFSYLNLQLNNLTAFSLPASLKSFDVLEIDYNQLTSFSLPASLTSFYTVNLDNTCNLDCTACTSVPTIYNDIYDQFYITWQGTVLVRDVEQKAAFEADEKWKQYKIEVKE